jgi:hypothetical protein
MANDGMMSPAFGGAFSGTKDKSKMKKLVEALAAKGRDGDTMLAHINPQEAQWLDQWTDGGSINPKTGLPEFADDSGQVSNATNTSSTGSSNQSGSGGYGGGGSSGGGGNQGGANYGGGYVSNQGNFPAGSSFTDPLSGGSYTVSGYNPNGSPNLSYNGGSYTGHDAYPGQAMGGGRQDLPFQRSGHIGNTTWGYNSHTNPMTVTPPMDIAITKPVTPAVERPVTPTPTTAYGQIPGQPPDQSIPGETIDYQTPMDVFSAFNRWSPTVDWSDPNTYAQSGRPQPQPHPKQPLGRYPKGWTQDQQLGFDPNWSGRYGRDPNVAQNYDPNFQFGGDGSMTTWSPEGYTGWSPGPGQSTNQYHGPGIGGYGPGRR